MDLFEAFLQIGPSAEAPELQPPYPDEYCGLSVSAWLDRVELVERTELMVEGIPQSVALTPRIEAVHGDLRVQLRATDSGKLLITMLASGDQTMGFNKMISQSQYWVTHATLRMTGSEFSRFRELVDQANARSNGRLL